MRVVVFGRRGQVATELQRRVPADVSIEVIGRERADFRDPSAVTKAAGEIDADAFINAVAYNQVDRAETDADTTRAVNAVSVGCLASVAADRAIPLVHISTDYVFDGTGDTPRTPDAQAAPIGVYGQSKREGEIAVCDAGGRYAIVRTSWVFSAHGSNFVKSMLRLADCGSPLRIVNDQIGGPTPAAALSSALYVVARKLTEGSEGGIYHFAGAPDVSWAEFAREIFERSGTSVDVTGISTTDYPTEATRPLNSRLDCESTLRDFGIARPDWRDGLSNVLKELGVT